MKIALQLIPTKVLHALILLKSNFVCGLINNYEGKSIKRLDPGTETD